MDNVLQTLKRNRAALYSRTFIHAATLLPAFARRGLSVLAGASDPLPSDLCLVLHLSPWRNSMAVHLFSMLGEQGPMLVLPADKMLLVLQRKQCTTSTGQTV